MNNENKMENENEEQLQIDQTSRETINVSVNGKYIDVELEVEIEESSRLKANNERHFHVMLSFHDDDGNESYITLIRDNKGRFTVHDGRYLDR